MRNVSMYRLTPIIEDMDELKLGSSSKKCKDDYILVGTSTKLQSVDH